VPLQESINPIGLRDVLVKARKMLSFSALSDESITNIKKTIDSLSDSATREQVIKAYASIKSLKKSISDPKNEALVVAYVMKPLLKTIGREYDEKDQDNKGTAINRERDLRSQYYTEESTIHGLKDFGPKGQDGRGINTRTRIYNALDNLILKLAALQQPLGIRPDYGSGQGTSGDMSERLKRVRKDLMDNEAAMLKMIPPMQDYDEQCPPGSPEAPVIEDYDEGPQAEGPQVIMIEDYDEGQQECPCCPACGQEMPQPMTKQAHCVDHKFKTIRELLNKKDLTEGQIKTIRHALDEIYKKYRALEKEIDD